MKQLTLIVAVVICLLVLSACEKGASPTADGSPQKPSAPSAGPPIGMPAAAPSAGPAGEAPPLAPPVDEAPSLDELVQQVAETEKLGGSRTDGDGDDDKTYLYRWIDNEGQLHIASDLAMVPVAYRDRVQKIESLTDGAKANDPAPPAYDPNVFRKQKEAQETSYKQWTAKLDALRAKLAKLTLKREKVENTPPDCSLAVVPQITGGYDPNCEQRWKDEIAALKEQETELAAAIEKLREDARRAGVPPGYVR